MSKDIPDDDRKATLPRSAASDMPVPFSAMAPRALATLRRVSAIPTLWNGVQFRSRLEARWAAFFTELKLPWAYEPEELKWYIPDFILRFPKPLLVEVKPSDEELEYAKHKIKHSGWDGDALIAVSGETAAWGHFHETGYGWDVAQLGFCLACKTPVIVAAGGRWACRSCGCAERKQLWWAFDCREAWKSAGNATQWRSGT